MKKCLLILFLLPLFTYSQIRSQSGLFPIEEFGKMGYINSRGEIVIKCQFDGAENFSEGLAAVAVDTLWGFIDSTGRFAIAPQYDSRGTFSGGLCNTVWQKDGRTVSGFIKKDGSVAFVSRYEDISPFSHGVATVTIKNKVWLVDTSGKKFFNTHLEYGGQVSEEGIVHVWGTKGKKDITRYYDNHGKLLLEIPEMGHDDFVNGLAHVRIHDTSCYINMAGQTVIIPERQDLTYWNFSEGLAQAVEAATSNRWYIDTTGKIALTVPYSEIGDFHEGLAFVRSHGKWGFIDKAGREVISPKFTRPVSLGFNNGLCRVKEDHRWGYIDHTGVFVWKEQFGIEYTKLNLAQWTLDTLSINEPNLSHYYGGYDNYPRPINFKAPDSLKIFVDTTDVTRSAYNHIAYKLYISNGSRDTVSINAQAGYYKIVEQAINSKGDWQDIETFYNSFCGNDYYQASLPPEHYQIIAAPIYKGQLHTQLRFRFELGEKTIFSNEYRGNINPGQFLAPKDKHETGIIVTSY
ncbi:MAG: WG repeat-containing protein [Bacteroidetes bacterium]|nr:WG repeat-containing protein [Bacteroidota bacterium]